MHLEHVFYLIIHLFLDTYGTMTSHDHTAKLTFSNSECECVGHSGSSKLWWKRR